MRENDHRIRRTVCRTIFPNIEKWMIEHDETIRDFCEAVGIYHESYCRMMYRVGNPKLSTIRAVMEHTGMSFEEAFEEG